MNKIEMEVIYENDHIRINTNIDGEFSIRAFECCIEQLNELIIEQSQEEKPDILDILIAKLERMKKDVTRK